MTTPTSRPLHSLILLFILALLLTDASAFIGRQPILTRAHTTTTNADLSPNFASRSASSLQRQQRSRLAASTVSQQDAQKGIDIVVAALRRDKTAIDELGRLLKVNNVLGYGSPNPGTLLLRFNASFQKSGMGRSSIPMPFGLGQTNKSEGRGTMVGQVKAEVRNGKVTSCSVFRDLGYGRSFMLKC